MKNNDRAGFTLVELMVAMALTLFVMVILTQAFVTSLETFSAMKGIGDMQQNLRTAGHVLRADLSANHFEGDRRLSDVDAVTGLSALVPSNLPGATAQLPQAGFFAVWQGSASVLEGLDSTNVPSYRADNHAVYMTVRRRGNQPQNFYTAPLQGTAAVLGQFFGVNSANPPQSAYGVNPITQLPIATYTPPYQQGATSAFYSSQWAEVLYFLYKTGSTEEPNNPNSTIGTPTFGLYRAQFAMVPNASAVNTLVPPIPSALCQSTFAGLSSNPGATGLQFNSPDMAATGLRMLPTLNAATMTAIQRGTSGDPRFTVADASAVGGVSETGANYSFSTNLLLPNVISFQVQIMPTADAGLGSNFTDVHSLHNGANGAYDTTKFGAAGYPATGLKAIQVTLRVFDPASRQSRQMTIVQDL